MQSSCSPINVLPPAKNTVRNSRPASLDLNLNLNLSSTRPIDHNGFPSDHALSNPLGCFPCSRCLSYKHSRPNCWRPVRCSSCFRLGHHLLGIRVCPLPLSLPIFARITLRILPPLRHCRSPLRRKPQLLQYLPRPHVNRCCGGTAWPIDSSTQCLFFPDYAPGFMWKDGRPCPEQCLVLQEGTIVT